MSNYKRYIEKIKRKIKIYLPKRVTVIIAITSIFYGVIGSIIATYLTQDEPRLQPSQIIQQTHDTNSKSESEQSIEEIQKKQNNIPNYTKNELNLNSMENLKYFPLEKDNFWKYDFYSKKTNYDGKIIEFKDVLEVRVLNVYRNNTFIIVELSANPLDGNNEVCGLLLYYDKIYLINNVESIVKSSNDEVLEYISKQEPKFLFPLFDGQTYGYQYEHYRPDTGYMYKVTELNKTFNTNEDNKQLPMYKIEYETLSGCFSTTFVPNLGIASVKYKHHGTVMEYELELIDYKIHKDQ